MSTTLDEIRDLMAQQLEVMKEIRDALASKPMRPVPVDKVPAAYAALSQLGPNYSAIAEEIGVSRKTLERSIAPKWVKWRDMFQRVKYGRSGQIIGAMATRSRNDAAEVSYRKGRE